MLDFPNLARLIRPESVAVVGASDTPGSIGRRTMDNLLVFSDFRGTVYLVNSRREQIDGHPCYPDVASLPEAPDVAVVVIPAAHVIQSLEQCAAKGVRFAIVLSSGFGEAGATGTQDRMREIAAESGMRVYGPNCPGLTNIADRIGMTFSPAFADDDRSGPLGIATQGGGLGRTLVQAGERGSGVALWASLGNAADLDVADFVHHMAFEDRIEVIGTLLEGVRDGAKLVTAIRTASERGKPVVALKVGHSQYGVRAVLSHTAAMAGSATTTSAVLAQLGAVEVTDTDELVDVAWLLARAPAPEDPRIAVYGQSGGALALAADMVGTAGLRLADLEGSTTTSLREVLPDFAAVENPIDTTATTITDPELLDRTLLLVAEDPNVDLVLLPIPLDYGDHSDRLARGIVAAQQATSTPLLPVWMSDRHGPGWTTLAAAGFCSPTSLTKAVLAVRRWATYGRWKAADDRSPAPAPLLLQQRVSSALPDVRTEPEAKQWLQENQLPVTEGVLVHSAEEARDAAEQLGGPLVVKIVSPDVPHKSDAGGVVVGASGADQVAEAWERVCGNVVRDRPDAAVEGVLVERMVPDDGIDMLVGVHRDPVFGHLLSVGSGGVYVEVLDDVQRRMLPVDRRLAEEMVASLRCRPLLEGARGRPRCDVRALVDLLLAVSDVVSAHADHIEEIDLNPVRVRPMEADGPTVVVLDAAVVAASR